MIDEFAGDGIQGALGKLDSVIGIAHIEGLPGNSAGKNIGITGRSYFIIPLKKRGYEIA